MARSGRLHIDRPTPVAARREHTTTWHGRALQDPYAWLKDPGYPEVDDPDVLAHLREENAYFEAAIGEHRPLVERIYKELEGRQKQDESSYPYRDRGYLYHARFAAGAQYACWYRQPVDGGPEQLLLDEPALAAGQPYFRLGGFDISPDDRLIAWAEDVTGGERFRIRVRRLDTGELLPLEIPECGGAPLFAGDGRHLLYVRLTEEWRPYQVRAHRLGSDLADDVVLYEEADESFFVGVDSTQSDEWIAISSGDHVTSEVRLLPMANPLAPARLVVARRSGHEYDLDHAAGEDGGWFYIRSNDTHRNFRLARAPVATPEPAHWQELIAPSDNRYLRGHAAFANVLVVQERVDGLDQLRVCELNVGTAAGDFSSAEREHYVVLPEPVYSVWLGANAEPQVAQLRLGYTSLVTPATVFDYDLGSRTLLTRKVQEIPSGYDASLYTSERQWATARDGTRVPVSIVYRRDRARAPGLLHLYAYGAYGLAESPTFSASRLSLLDRGFAFAIAHVRGGDDLGRAWYEDGKLAKRENTFRDFVDVARHLVSVGLARAGRISISGGSAGGTLMGAVTNMAPDLWGAVVAHVPFVDVLNTMLDASLPLTPIEWPEWGNPIEDAAAYDLLLGYSPYDNVTAKAYPPLLVTAGLHDPRVTYWEPAKWVAMLRHHKTDDNVLLLKTNMEAGHGGKSGRFVQLEETAEEFAFILLALDVGGAPG